MTSFKGLAGLAITFGLLASTAMAGELVMNSDQSDPAPKKAMEELIAGFEAANPDIKVNGTTSTMKATSQPSATS